VRIDDGKGNNLVAIQRNVACFSITTEINFILVFYESMLDNCDSLNFRLFRCWKILFNTPFVVALAEYIQDLVGLRCASQFLFVIKQ